MLVAVPVVRCPGMQSPAGERLAQQGLEDVVTHQVTIRHRTDITTENRFVVGSRAFNIKGIFDPEDDKARYLVMLCDEGVAT